ncbi:MAG: DUF5320 domain-containing protein [Bacteroidetes bacterium]|nr:DUF5320 domain-containing protein [Bacteroidota bacterium]
MKTVKKISDEFIEVVETVERTEVKQFNKNVLNEEKRMLEKRIKEINSLLKEF